MSQKHSVKKYHAKLVVPALLATMVAGILAGCAGNNDTDTAAGAMAPRHMQGAGPAAASWTSVKWGGGGYVTGLVYHPVNSSVLYARTDVGGAYRWNAANSTWIPITDGVGFSLAESPYHNVESLALDPTNDQKVYLATGQGSTGRLYVSSDRGSTWSWYTLPFLVGGNDDARAIGERLKLDPTNPSTMFYGSRNAGLWKSTDSGQTWNQVTSLSSVTMSGSGVGVEHLMFDNSGVGGGATTWIMYAAIAPDYVQAAGLTSTLYKSTDGGGSWTPVAVPSAVAGYYIPHIVRTNDGMFYMTFNQNKGQGPGGAGYLYKFGGTVGNGSWNLLKSTVGNTNGGYAGVSVYGTGATARIALGVTGTWGNNPGQVTQLSNDNGLTWHEIEAGMPGQTNGWNDQTVIDPGNRDHIMHIHGGGIVETWQASAATPNWFPKVNNLEEVCPQILVTPPAGTTAYKLLSGSGDVGTWVHTDLAAKPTKTPLNAWSSGNALDLAWSDTQYIAGAGIVNDSKTGFGFWSGNGGNTWSNFATLPPNATLEAKATDMNSIAVPSRNNVVWAVPDQVPYYTTNNGASWIATNLPALPAVNGTSRSYRLAADRKNPNKVYAYDSGAAWWNKWSDTAHFYASTDGGHTFTERTAFKGTSPMTTYFGNTSIAVNPNAEGDIWLVDGDALYHSTDSGVSWTKSTTFASVWGANAWPDVQGAIAVTLGKAAAGSTYSAAVYVSGVIGGKWGVWRSDDAGATWSRFNDDTHQFGGIGHMAGDWNTYGRVYVSGAGRGFLYTN